MRFVHAALVLSVLCAAAGLAATAPTKTTTKKATSKAVPSKVTTRAVTKAPVTAAKTSTGSTKSSTARSKVVAKAKKPASPPAPRRQLTPTPDRYKEIQQALINKGYLHGDPSGVWDSDSVAAMQRFQSAQKEMPTGKITAASLIGLGLGAKSAGAPEAPPLGGHAASGDQSVPAPPAATSAPAASQ